MRLEFEADASVVPLAHERRRHKRDDLCFKVRFSVLAEADALRVLDDLKLETNPTSGNESFAENFSSGGLGLCGPLDTLRGRTLQEGDYLRIEIQPPRMAARVRCVGEVSWAEMHFEAGIFRAGVRFVAVNPEDLEQLHHPANGG